MTLDDFIKKYQGKKVEYHSYNANALYQCVDLANQYITEVLGLPAIIGTNAQDFPSKLSDNYDWTLNTPNGLPTKGDLMIFRSDDNVGHISIFIDGNLSLFKSFDQNYPTGSPCQIVQHNYRNVLGWLHPRKVVMATMYKGLDLTNQDSMKVAVDVWDEVINKKLYVKKSDIQDRFGVPDLDGIATKLSGKDSRITDLTNQLGTAQAEQQNKEELLSRAQATVLQLQDDIKGLNDKLDLATNAITQLGKDKGNLAIEVEQLKIQVETLKQGQLNSEVTLSISDLFKMLWNQKITIKKG